MTEPPIKPTTCTPDEWDTLVGIVSEMSYGQMADLLRDCLAVTCHRVHALRGTTDGVPSTVHTRLRLAVHAATGINGTLDRIDFLHDPRPVDRFLAGAAPVSAPATEVPAHA